MPGAGDVDAAWPLVGRERELAAVVSAYDRMAAGDATAGAVLVGGAGIGKTRLAHEAVRCLRARDVEAVWATASRSASTVPLGAFAHLIGTAVRTLTNPSAPGHLDALVSLVARFAGRSDPPCVVMVDDANLLDEASAAFLHHLAQHRYAFVLLTARARESAPDAVTSMWTTNSIMRIELARLVDDAILALLTHALGRMDPVSEGRLLRTCAGSPLLLRELILAGDASDAFRCAGGLWRWRGSDYTTDRLIEVVQTRLVAAAPGLASLLQPLAWAEPLPVHLLDTIAGRDAVLDAERLGLLVVDSSGNRLTARLAQPIHAEVVRAGTPAYRRREVWRSLALALESMPMRRRDDAMHAALWRLRAGLPPRQDLLLPAARRACSRADLGTAEVLALAARVAGIGWGADLTLAEVHAAQGRYAEAADVLPSMVDHLGADQRARWYVVRDAMRYWGADRLAGEGAQPDDADPPDHAAEASRAWRLLSEGACSEALRVGTAVLTAALLPGGAANWAATAVIASAGLLGRHDQAVAALERGLAAADANSEAHAWGPTQVGAAGCLALLATGQLRKAAELVEDRYRRAVALAVESDAASTILGIWTILRGMVARAQGKVRTAVEALSEATHLLGDRPTYGLNRIHLAELAGVHALAWDFQAAHIAMDRCDARTDSPALFDAWIERNRGWLAVATGDIREAVRRLHHAAERARATEQPTIEALALFDVARLGHAAAVRPRLAELAMCSDAPVIGHFASAATALHERDTYALAAASAAFGESGHLLHAAEAAAAAAREAARTGRHATSRTMNEHVAALVLACEGARTPILTAEVAACSPLTARERHIATLAATGHASAEIAAQLGISIRTVNNHLGRAYTKLGITGRAQLTKALRLTQPYNLDRPVDGSVGRPAARDQVSDRR